MQRRRRRGRKFRPLATKVFFFTVTLMFWAVAVMFAYDLSTENFDVSQAALLCIVILLVAGAVAQFTSRVLVRPLSRLQEGIIAVQKGELAFIEVSRTHDEVEFLGKSFNRMIQALADSKREINLRTTELEAAIQRAHEAHTAQTDFLAGLSRQLGAPLNEIAEIIDQTAEASAGNSESRDQLQTTQQGADTLLTLLNQLQHDASQQAAGALSRK